MHAWLSVLRKNLGVVKLSQLDSTYAILMAIVILQLRYARSQSPLETPVIQGLLKDQSHYFPKNDNPSHLGSNSASVMTQEIVSVHPHTVSKKEF